MSESSLRGRLIVVEGIDGAGKSTVVSHVAQLLKDDGCYVVTTREPGGTQLGAHLRSLIGQGVCKEVPEAEYLLFAADRALHIQTLVRPALHKGAIVLSDRMGDSSVAYQGYGRGVSLDLINAVNNTLMRDIQPDLTIYLMIDYATAYQRLAQRGGETMHYDREKASFFQKVIEGYEALYAHRKNVLRIDASRSLETVTHQVYHKLCEIIGSPRDEEQSW